MKAPFLGTKILTGININDIYKLINTRELFSGKWQFKRTSASEEAHRRLLKQKAWPALEELKKRCREEKIFEPKIAYGYFEKNVVARFIGQDRPNKLGNYNFTPLQIVTVGQKVIDKCHWLFSAHEYTNYLYLNGLAAACAEALAEYSHGNILTELQIRFDKGRRLAMGSRISPGYKAWPELSDQKKLVELLSADRIGISITETYQLVPEYSTSAMIII